MIRIISLCTYKDFFILACIQMQRGNMSEKTVLQTKFFRAMHAFLETKKMYRFEHWESKREIRIVFCICLRRFHCLWYLNATRWCAWIDFASNWTSCSNARIPAMKISQLLFASVRGDYASSESFNLVSLTKNAGESPCLQSMCRLKLSFRAKNGLFSHSWHWNGVFIVAKLQNQPFPST